MQSFSAVNIADEVDKGKAARIQLSVCWVGVGLLGWGGKGDGRDSCDEGRVGSGRPAVVGWEEDGGGGGVGEGGICKCIACAPH